MADSLGGAMTEQFITGAQKSTNKLKALLAKLLPAVGDESAGSECSGSSSTVDALLSDITDSLSQALASLRLGAFGNQALPAPPGQISSGGGGGGGRRSAPKRSGQRVRMDAVCRMIVLQNGIHDSYTWKKYGQKEILGARFPRSYFKCGKKSGCPAKKQVQQSDADPSKLEITYIDEHTCDGQPSSSFAPCARTDDRFQRPEDHRYSSSWLCSNSSAYEETACTPSMEQEQAVLLFVPSPACSQSELLPAEVPMVAPHSPPVSMEHKLACDDEGVIISDFVVPVL